MGINLETNVKLDVSERLFRTIFHGYEQIKDGVAFMKNSMINFETFVKDFTNNINGKIDALITKIDNLERRGG